MQKYLALLVIVSLCLSSVSSTTTVFAPSTALHTVCPASFTLANTRLYAEETASTTVIPAIADVSYSNGANADSSDNIEYRYSFGATTPWAVTLSVTSDLGTTINHPLAHAATPDFAPTVIGLIRSVLVIKSTTGGASPVHKYYAYCGSFPTAGKIANGIQLRPPTGHTITEMRLVLSTESNTPALLVYMVGMDATSAAYKGFYAFILTEAADSTTFSTPFPSANNANFRTASASATGFGSIIGSDILFYNKDESTATAQFKQYTGSNYANVLPVLARALVDDQVLHFSLDNDAEVLFVRKFANKQSAKLAVKVGDTAIPAANINVFTPANSVNVFSDRVKNLIAVGNDQIVWVYTRFTNNAEFINSVAITSAAVDADIITATNIAFSKDKAFVLRPTRILQYQVVPAVAPATDAINLLASISVSRNLIAPTAELQWKGQVKCQCNTPGVKRFTCFTTTLGCLVTALNSFSNCAPGG